MTCNQVQLISNRQISCEFTGGESARPSVFDVVSSGHPSDFNPLRKSAGSIVIRIDDSDAESPKDNASFPGAPPDYLFARSSTLTRRSTDTLYYEDLENVANNGNCPADPHPSLTPAHRGAKHDLVTINNIGITENDLENYMDVLHKQRGQPEVAAGVTRINVEFQESDQPSFSPNREERFQSGQESESNWTLRERTEAPSENITSLSAPVSSSDQSTGEMTRQTVSRGVWAPRVHLASGAAPIQMTGWRVNPNFDSNPSDTIENSASLSRNPSLAENRQSQRRRPENLLSPGDLFHLYSNHIFPPRYEDSFGGETGESKNCCCSFGQPRSSPIRWLIGAISLLGVVCVVIGTVLGAISVAGPSRLALCVLMIGVGLVLITVSGLTWRLMGMGVPRRNCCRLLQRLFPGAASVFPFRVFTPYTRVGSNRNSNLLTGRRFFSEFNWRPPPPSYLASIQETRFQRTTTVESYAPPVGSPPPTYRATPPRRIIAPSISTVNERPPCYRSHEASPATTIESRPFSRLQEVGNGQPSSDTVSCTNASPNRNFVEVNISPASDAGVQPVSDRRQQMSSNMALKESDVLTIPITDWPPDRRVSIIDCSTATPMGFQVPGSPTNFDRPGQPLVNGEYDLCTLPSELAIQTRSCSRRLMTNLNQRSLNSNKQPGLSGTVCFLPQPVAPYELSQSSVNREAAPSPAESLLSVSEFLAMTTDDYV